MTLAEQKKYLLIEIDKALKMAPAEVDSTSTTTERRFGSGYYSQRHEVIDDRVVIRIPDTSACYRIYNTQEALKAFAKEAHKGLNKQWYNPSGTIPSLRATTPKAKPLEDVIEGIYRGAPCHVNRFVCLLTAPALKPKNYIEQNNKDIKSYIDKTIYDIGEEVNHVYFITDRSYRDTEVQGVSNVPSTMSKTVRLVSTGRTTYIPQSAYLYVKLHYPDAKFYIIDGMVAPIVVHSDGEPVGCVGRMSPRTTAILEGVTGK